MKYETTQTTGYKIESTEIKDISINYILKKHIKIWVRYKHKVLVYNNPKDVKLVNSARFRLSYITEREEYFEGCFLQSETEQYITMFNRIIMKRPWENCNPTYVDYDWRKEKNFYEYMKKRWEQQQMLIDYVRTNNKLLANEDMKFKFDNITVNINEKINTCRGNGGAHRLSTIKILGVRN